LLEARPVRWKIPLWRAERRRTFSQGKVRPLPMTRRLARHSLAIRGDKERKAGAPAPQRIGTAEPLASFGGLVRRSRRRRRAVWKL